MSERFDVVILGSGPGGEPGPFEEGWDIVRRVAEEVKQYTPALLSPEPLPDLEIQAPAAVHWTAACFRLGSLLRRSAHSSTAPRILAA